MDGGARGVAGGERRLAGDCGDADYAGGALGLEADADGKDYSGFSEWEDAWIRGDGTEFCGSGRVRGGPPAGGGAWQGWRAIFAGSGEPDPEKVAGFVCEDNRLTGAGD